MQDDNRRRQTTSQDTEQCFFGGERSEEEDEVGMPEWMFHIGTNPCLEKRRPDRSGTFLNSDFGPFWALHIMFFYRCPCLVNKDSCLVNKESCLVNKEICLVNLVFGMSSGIGNSLYVCPPGGPKGKW